MSDPPQSPAGPLVLGDAFHAERKDRCIDRIAEAPAKLKHAVAGMRIAQLEARYRNWTVRQIVHHLGDSHIHSYIRFKWTLTEERPTIKAYAENDWVQLADSQQGSLTPTLTLLEGLHARWVELLRGMEDAQFSRSFCHPETGEWVSLWQAIQYYAWHGEHHTAQVLWVRQHYDIEPETSAG